MSDMLRQKSQQISKHTDNSMRTDSESGEKEMLISKHSSLKPGNSRIPAQHYCSCACLKFALFACTGLLLALLIPSAVYYFINDADIMDEHFDLAGLEDLTTADKLSIRVSCPDNLAQLQKFVAHYSICPHVFEIGVVATPSCQSLEGVPFQYLKVGVMRRT
jgi:hypothetical protein